MMLIRKCDRFFFFFLSYNQFRILKLSKEEVKLNVTYFLKLSEDDLFTIFSKNISGT